MLLRAPAESDTRLMVKISSRMHSRYSRYQKEASGALRGHCPAKQQNPGNLSLPRPRSSNSHAERQDWDREPQPENLQLQIMHCEGTSWAIFISSSIHAEESLPEVKFRAGVSIQVCWLECWEYGPDTDKESKTLVGICAWRNTRDLIPNSSNADV